MFPVIYSMNLIYLIISLQILGCDLTDPKTNGLHLKLESQGNGFHFTKLLLGGQPFNILLDTGSFRRWVASNKSRDKYLILRQNKYAMERSKDAKVLVPSANLNYLTSCVHGPVVQDNLKIGDFSLKDFVFMEAISHPGGPADALYDGVLGLRRYSSLDNMFKQTVLDHLMSSNLIHHAVYTFRFCRGDEKWGTIRYGDGDVVFGEIREAYHKFRPVYIKVNYQWFVRLTCFRFGKVESRPFDIQLDTGSPFIFGPEKSVKEMYEDLKVTAVHKNGLAYVSCNHINQYPSMEIIIGSKTFVFSARELIVQVNHNSKVQCLFMITYLIGYNKTHWIAGMPFLRKFHTIFDQTNMQVGFAEVNC